MECGFRSTYLQKSEEVFCGVRPFTDRPRVFYALVVLREVYETSLS